MLLQGWQRGGPADSSGGGVMISKVKVCALDRLLLERFGGKAGRGLALELPLVTHFGD
jgi:hypothetical protein